MGLGYGCFTCWDAKFWVSCPEGVFCKRASGSRICNNPGTGLPSTSPGSQFGAAARRGGWAAARTSLHRMSCTTKTRDSERSFLFLSHPDFRFANSSAFCSGFRQIWHCEPSKALPVKVELGSILSERIEWPGKTSCIWFDFWFVKLSVIVPYLKIDGKKFIRLQQHVFIFLLLPFFKVQSSLSSPSPGGFPLKTYFWCNQWISKFTFYIHPVNVHI